MITAPGRRVARRGALALLTTALLATTVGIGAAEAAPSSTLLYSTDGGTSWSSTVTAAPGQSVLVRHWFDNDGDAAETSASIQTSLPAGFVLDGGSTEVCLNPSTTNPTAPDATEELCADAVEAAVWSGSDLQVSPSAGHYGESTSATVGQLPFGRKGYLNLQQCSYQPGSTTGAWRNTAVPRPTGPGANTNASNTAATGLDCGPNGDGWNIRPNSSGFQALDLLGRRYLNLQQCTYSENTDGFYSSLNPTPFGGTSFNAYTTTSNTSGPSQPCGPTSGSYAFAPNSSGFQALDLRNARYLNLHECHYIRNADGGRYSGFNPTIAGGASFNANTNASNTADAVPACGSPGTGWSLVPASTAFSAIDLLDTERGHGFVAYSMTAPEVPSEATCAAGVPASESFEQTGALVLGGAIQSQGTVSVDWSQLTDPCGTPGISVAHPGMVGAGLVALAGVGSALRRRQQHVIA